MKGDNTLTIRGISVPVKRSPFAEWLVAHDDLPPEIYKQAAKCLLGLAMLDSSKRKPPSILVKKVQEDFDKLEEMLATLPRSQP